MPEGYRSVAVSNGSRLRRFASFAGPAFLVSVGYMDPGNWATDLSGGSQFGMTLLWVILGSNFMAMLLQTLCVRLGIATGRDLAQACRDFYPRPAAYVLWFLCEIAIIACDLAEVIGSAVAMKLLFGIPLEIGVIITGFDVMLLLALLKFGFRKIEAVIFVMVATIFICFGIQTFLAQPNWAAVGHGLITPSLPNYEAQVIAVGILGATVMPHNLYLHSSIVQTRAYDLNPAGKWSAIRNGTVDTLIALAGAFFVNAAILVLAGAVFHKNGVVVTELEQAHELLTPMLGGMAATLFAVALLCSGQASTLTGTFAGQIVMEGFLRWKVKPWVRRLITRGIALVPALILVHGAGDMGTVKLLVLSQVVLTMQLPFAVIPLVMFTSDKRRMGEFASPVWMQVLAYLVSAIIVGVNLSLLWQQFGPAWVLGGFGVALAFGIWVKYFWKETKSAAS